MLANAKILLTGPTSQVAFPLAVALAREHRVTGVARFSSPKARAKLEAAGVECISLDLTGDPHDALPRVKTGDFDHDLAANVEGLGRLLSWCRDAKALLHCSSGGVYAPPGHTPAKETDPLGDNHRGVMPTYSICKIAAEAMARFAAREYGLPTTIARFSVPYGDNGGWPWYHLMMMKSGVPIPVHTDAPCLYNPIHEDDYIAQVPKLLDAASVPATIVNWAGPDVVSLEEWCAYLGQLTGLEPKFAPTESTIPSLPLDTTRMHALIGPGKVRWRDGIRRLVEVRNPELLR
jgi:nucleoside-diphosphate-sugar epimerase